MKPSKHILFLFTLFIALTLAACGATEAAPPVDAGQPNPQSTEPDQTVTAAPEPTATAALLPCMIAFESDRDGNREIYVMGPDGRDPVNLTNHPADDWNPVWSPDGSQIAFVSNRENEGGSAQCIYVMNADGSDVHELISDYYNDHPDWSHDGTHITFISGDDVFIASADGSSEQQNLTESEAKDFKPTWSPDGSRIAWLSGHDGSRNIFVMNADGSNTSQLTSDGLVYDVKWTVDGRIFTHWKNDAAGCFNCLMDADGSNIKDAGGKGTLQQYFPFWTVDGQRVELVSGSLDGGDEEIHLVGEIFPEIFFNLTNNPANDRNPDWPATCGPRGNSDTVY